MATLPSPRAFILAVDDDAAVGRAVERDLRRRYGARHRVLLADSGETGLGLVEQIVRRGEPVALLVADQRMPGMSGVEFLAQALKVAPDAKRVLLTAYADTEAAIRAINELRLDHYLMKPWDPPEARLYPVLDDLLEDWEADTAARLSEPGLRLVGHRFSAEAHTTRDFVARNGVPYRGVGVALRTHTCPPATAACTAPGSGMVRVTVPAGVPASAEPAADARAGRHPSPAAAKAATAMRGDAERRRRSMESPFRAARIKGTRPGPETRPSLTPFSSPCQALFEGSRRTGRGHSQGTLHKFGGEWEPVGAGVAGTKMLCQRNMAVEVRR